MGARVLQAVTFDFWDTLVIDDSDEVERARLGLPPKKVARRDLFVDEVSAWHEITREAAAEAWEQANAHFRHQWHVEHHTPHISQRVRDAFARLGLEPTQGFDRVVDELATMEVTTPPLLAPGIGDALELLAGRYRLGIISDTIVTPGVGLREILRGHGLLGMFQHLVFSDEVGVCKPAPRVFQLAAAGLGVSPRELAHVGDRESNDVAGPHVIGAKAVLYVGIVDRGSAETTADVVCEHHDRLAAALASLEGE